MDNIPTTINISTDVPVDFRASDQYGYMYCFNFEYEVVAQYSTSNTPEGTDYYYQNSFYFKEIKGGLAYFSNGWLIFPKRIQNKYSDYVAEKELLGDT